MNFRAFSTAFFTLCVASLFGCAADDDPTPALASGPSLAPNADPSATPGEAFVGLRGTVVTEAGMSVEDPRLVLSWTVSAGSPDFTVVTASSAPPGPFPAPFSYELSEPPPDAALNDYTYGGRRPDETRIGVAHLAMLPASFDASDDDLPEGTPWGLAENHLVVYVDRDAKPGTSSARFLSGPLRAGYHVMRVVRHEGASVAECLAAAKAVNPAIDEAAVAEACERSFDILVESPQGLATPIEVRIAIEHEIPEWT
jgi:hypothetical protein